jgi:hypothetical protein
MPDLNELLPMLGLIAVIGAFAGVIAGLLGVGGGIFLVPTFFFAFERLGYTTPDLMQICLATSLATIVVTSVRSLMSHNRKGAVDWAILKGWGPGIAIGAGLGVIAATGLRSEVLMAIFGILGRYGRPLPRLRAGDLAAGRCDAARAGAGGDLAGHRVPVGPDGHRRRQFRRAADDALRRGDPPGGGDGGGLRRHHRGAGCDRVSAGAGAGAGPAALSPSGRSTSWPSPSWWP